MNCTANCNQGRNACPCPTACEVPEHDPRAMRTFWLAYVGVVSAMGAAAAFFSVWL